MSGRTTRTNRLAQRAGELALIVAGLATAFALIELAVLPRLVDGAPIKHQAHFPPNMQILAQSSKDSLVPSDYVLLVGDSFAEGHGDWLDAANRDESPAYHSAHVIHERLAVDVLSFGEGGAGSITGFALAPVRRMRALRRFGLESPQTVLAYFYEGNDLNNNLRYLRRHDQASHAADHIRDAEYMDAFIEDEVEKFLRSKHWVDKTFVFPYLVKLMKHGIRRVIGDRADATAWSTAPPDVNVVLVAGDRVSLPDALQSPALELSREDLELALLVTDRAIGFLRRSFPEAELHVVYLPSPLATYEIAADRVGIERYEEGERLHPSARVYEYSDAIEAVVHRIAERHGAGYLDARPILRERARTELVHGPHDWAHLNETGYRVLGEAIAAHLGARVGR